MNIRRLSPVLCVLAFSALEATAQLNVSQSPGRESISPRVAVDSRGNPHAVWVEKTGPTSGDVYYAKGDVKTQQISAPINLSGSNTVYCDTQEMCAIAVDQSDRVYVVWTEGWSVAAAIKLRTCADGVWGAPVTVDTGLRFQAPRLAVSPDGNLYIVWWNNQWQVLSRARVNGAWEEARMISVWGLTSKMADIDVGTNIVGVALLQKDKSIGDYYQTVYLQRSAGLNAAWSPAALVAPNGLNQQHPSVRVDAADGVHVVWTDESGSRIVRYAKKSGPGFTSPVSLSPEEMLHYPFMSESGLDIYVVWQVGNYGNGTSVDYDVLGADGVWKGRQEVPGSSGVTYCDVAASAGAGAVYFLWDTALGTTNSEIFGSAKIVAVPNPSLSLSRDKLMFGAVVGGPVSGSQKVLVENTGSGARRWTATPSQPWIRVSPASGTGSGFIEIAVAPAGLSVGVHQGVVLVADPDASLSGPKTIAVTLVVQGSSEGRAPFGVFDTPTDRAVVRGSVPITGWALDDVGLAGVKIYRDPVAGETGGQPVYIGDAVFVEGARPDVEAAFPGHPSGYAAGWGYMLLSSFLPNQGNGTFVLRARAFDLEGRVADLGAKTIVADNAHDTYPFGAIDTPSQGGTASSKEYTNFGWALTQNPKTIATDGSTITVWVDGKPLGHPSYGHYRQDIAALFPGLANANGAVGYFHLDTTAFANGAHTIAWSVKDSGGNESGVGSRFFTILNAGATASAARMFATADQERISGFAVDARTPVYVRKGFDREARAEMIPSEKVRRPVLSTRELERLEIRVDGTTEAYLDVAGEPRPLPAGSAFDRATGTFTWQPGPGFLGSYDIVFVNEGARSVRRLEVRILPLY